MTKSIDLNGLENAKNNLSKIQNSLSNQEKIIETNQKALSDIINAREDQSKYSNSINESFTLLHDSYISAIKELQQSTKEVNTQLIEKLKEQNNLISNFLETEAKNFASKNLDHIKYDLEKQINTTTDNFKKLLDEQNNNANRHYKNFERQEKSMRSNLFFQYCSKSINCLKLIIFFIMLNIYSIAFFNGVLILFDKHLTNWIGFTWYILITISQFIFGSMLFLLNWDSEEHNFVINVLFIITNIIGLLVIFLTPYVAITKLSWFIM